MLQANIHWKKEESEYLWFRPILIKWLVQISFYITFGVLTISILFSEKQVVLLSSIVFIFSSILTIFIHFRFYKISSLLFLFGFTFLIFITSYLMRLSTVLNLLFGILIGAGILSSKKVTVTLFLIQVIYAILLASFGIFDWIPQKDPNSGTYNATSILFVVEILFASLIFAFVIRSALLNTILNQSKTAKFFETTLKSVEEGIIVTDLEQKVILINFTA